MVNKKHLKKVNLTEVIQQSAPKAGVPKSRKISNLGSFCRYVAFVGLWYGFTTPNMGSQLVECPIYRLVGVLIFRAGTKDFQWVRSFFQKYALSCICFTYIRYGFLCHIWFFIGRVGYETLRLVKLDLS